MARRSLLLLTAGLTAAGLAACGGSAAADAPAPAAAAKARALNVTTGKSAYGRIVFAGRRRALYLFTAETSKTPRCYGACAKAWPPALVRSRAVASSGARSALLGTTRRRDGSRQLTYAGHPVYYYVGDTQPGQVLCQNVVEFGGTWLVVNPDGSANTKPR